MKVEEKPFRETKATSGTEISDKGEVMRENTLILTYRHV